MAAMKTRQEEQQGRDKASSLKREGSEQRRYKEKLHNYIRMEMREGRKTFECERENIRREKQRLWKR